MLPLRRIGTLGGVVDDPEHCVQGPAAAGAALLRVVGEAFAGEAVVYKDDAPVSVRREVAAIATTAKRAFLQAL
jgi:hypothetical protein